MLMWVKTLPQGSSSSWWQAVPARLVGSQRSDKLAQFVQPRCKRTAQLTRQRAGQWSSLHDDPSTMQLCHLGCRWPAHRLWPDCRWHIARAWQQCLTWRQHCACKTPGAACRLSELSRGIMTRHLVSCYTLCGMCKQGWQASQVSFCLRLDSASLANGVPVPFQRLMNVSFICLG